MLSAQSIAIQTNKTYRATRLIVLAVRLNPMQPQRMQERRKTLHQTQNAQRQPEPRGTDEDANDNPDDAGHVLDNSDRHVPENLGQLGVCEGESPETEIGGRVGDTAEAELDGVNDLMDHDLREIMLFLSITNEINL